MLNHLTFWILCLYEVLAFLMLIQSRCLKDLLMSLLPLAFRDGIWSGLPMSSSWRRITLQENLW